MEKASLSKCYRQSDALYSSNFNFDSGLASVVFFKFSFLCGNAFDTRILLKV